MRKPDRFTRAVEKEQWLGARGFVIHSTKAKALLSTQYAQLRRLVKAKVPKTRMSSANYTMSGTAWRDISKGYSPMTGAGGGRMEIKVGDWVKYQDEKYGFIVIGEVVKLARYHITVQDFLCCVRTTRKTILEVASPRWRRHDVISSLD